MPTARRALWPVARVEKTTAHLLGEPGGEGDGGFGGGGGVAEEGAGETSPGRRRENKNGSPVPATGDRHRGRDGGGAPPEHFTCVGLLKHDRTVRRGENLSAAYGQWRAAQRATASRMERQLRARWALDEQIEAHLALLKAHYNRSMLPGRPRDVAPLLMPPWKPPLENAATSWLGDWRPSAVLSLLPRLVADGLSPRAQRYLSQVVRWLRIEEAVIDEQMAEHQSTFVLCLMGGGGREGRGRGATEEALGWVVEGMGRAEAVVARAQRLRYRAVEVAVRGMPGRAQAAEFLVGLTGVQDAVHRMATGWRAQVGSVHVAVHQAFPTAIETR